MVWLWQQRYFQIIIPKPIRVSHHWEVGQELIVVDCDDGILLKPKKPFSEMSLNDVVASLDYQGKAKTVEDMDDVIRRGVRGSM